MDWWDPWVHTLRRVVLWVSLAVVVTNVPVAMDLDTQTAAHNHVEDMERAHPPPVHARVAMGLLSLIAAPPAVHLNTAPATMSVQLGS